MYAQGTFGGQETALIKSPVKTFQLCYLNFYYHTSGTGVGFVNVSIVTQRGGELQNNTVLSLYGPQGSTWQRVRIPIEHATAAVPYLVRFIYHDFFEANTTSHINNVQLFECVLPYNSESVCPNTKYHNMT